eukprot:799387-Amphidinium_carterae.1
MQSRTTNELPQRRMKRKHVQQEGVLAYPNIAWELPELPTLTAGITWLCHWGRRQGGAVAYH